MRVRSLRIENLRAIEHFEIDNLGDFILIAGPNGCGKTTVLDALRLIKSLYVTDEWKRWFNEFGINVDRPSNFSTIFRNEHEPVSIAATFDLAVEESNFLLQHADNIALGLVINASSERKRITITGEPPLTTPTTSASHGEDYLRKARTLAKELVSALENSRFFNAAVTITSAPRLDVEPSPVAAAAFSCFSPEALGEIEFHSSRRLYAREAVNSVQLNIGDRSEERRNRFLYDLENKYKNIKSQLGEEYVAAVLKKADPEQGPLQRSIKELFRTFFPGKEFLGVTLGPNNALTFPVRLSTGETHDIDELSSGEKEIVYGYLWLRTGTPRRSVVLVDEPELHLNPALVHGLPTFYKTNLADALDVQVWVVTHSDAILRQAVRAQGMAVYHMARPLGNGAQQAVKIDSQNAVEAAVLDLIGDLAAYRPYAKIVLVEGHKETRFDVDMIRRLFPEYAERANFIPVGNRRMTAGVRVRLLEVLEEAGLAGRAVSICDSDLGLGGKSREPGHYEWPVYEIENFLLVPSILRNAAAVMLRNDPYTSDAAVVSDLRDAASNITKELALDELQYILNAELVGAIRIGGDPQNPLDGLKKSSAASQQRLAAVDLTSARIQRQLDEAIGRITAYIADDAFLQRFPGDRLLRAFAGKHGISGDHYRNACVDAAQRLGIRPSGMERTLLDALA